MSINRIIKEMLEGLRSAYNFPDGCFDTEERRVEMRFNPDYRRPKVVREMREFVVGGKKVMAYSRKDAIKRLRHRGK